jgi:hypothetical protein
MSGVFADLTAWGEAAAAERERMGFVWLGTCEADPRQPGPPMLAWGRTPGDALFVRVLTGPQPTGWGPTTEAEWRNRWPHSHVPSGLPAAMGAEPALLP